MKIKVELLVSQYGNLLVYINDERVIGPGHQGILRTIASTIVDLDSLPKEYDSSEEAPE